MKKCDWRGAECADVYLAWFSNPDVNQLTKIGFTKEEAELLLNGQQIEKDDDHEYYLEEYQEGDFQYASKS
jgi:hypothetical protein